jgi:hypothetical protein
MNGAMKRDRVLAVLFGTALLLVLLNVTSALLFATMGMAFLWIVKVSMLLTGVFAIAGASFGLVRAKQRRRAASRLIA